MENRTHPKMLPVLILMFALAITALALAMAPAVEGATIVVPDDYGTIQQAIDNASAGDTIRIHAGSYTESLVVDTRVDIIGNGTGETVIQGSVLDLVELNADGIALSKVRIDGGSTSGLYVKGANCTIEDIYVTGSSRGLRTSGADWLYIGNSTFTDNDDFGMIIHLSNNVTIYGCEVTWNEYDDGIRINAGQSNITISHTLVNANGYYGIEFMGNTDIRVDNCTITNNSDNGIYVTSSDRMVFEDNTIQWNLLFGIYTFQSTDIEVTDNLVSNNAFGIYIDNCADGEVKDNVAIDNDGVGIGLFDSGGLSPFWVHHNRVERNALVFAGLESGISVAGFSTADNNIIEDNEIVENHKGIMLRYSGSKDNVVRRNIIKDNKWGIENNNGAGPNTFYHNTFINNTVQVRAPHANDVYDSGYPNGGNFWDTYTGMDMYNGPTQDVSGPDSLGDTSFLVGGAVIDTYPLMRQFGDNPLASVSMIHPSDGDLVEGEVVAEAVVTGDVVSMVEWYLDGALVGRDSTLPYQVVIDTTTLSEDATYTLEAMAYLRLTDPMSDVVSITVNNEVLSGPFINVSTAASSYMPDDTVSAIVALMTPPSFDYIELHASWTGDDGTVVQIPFMSYPAYSRYGFIFRLPSDVPVGDVSLQVIVLAYSGGSQVWSSTNLTIFAVDGVSQGQQMAAILTDLTTVVEEIEGLNMTNQAQLVAALAEILSGLDGLEGSLADNNTALQEYIDLQTEQIQIYMVALNDSLSEQLAAIDQAVNEFRDEAGMELDGIFAYLLEMEANGSARHGEVLDGLDETYGLLEDINATTLDELRTKLIALSDDLAALDDDEASRHQNTVDVMVMELDGLSKEVTDGFNGTNSQLAALSKLDTILEQLNNLSDDVADIKDTSTGAGDSMWNMLLILAFGIITILLLAVLMGRVKDVGATPLPPPPTPTRQPRPVIVPAKRVAEQPRPDESFELMMEEPEMYPETEGPIMMTPEVPPTPEVEMEEVPPPPISEIPEAPTYEPYEVEEVAPPEFPPPVPVPEPIHEPESVPELEPEPEPELDLELEPEPEPELDLELEREPEPELDLELEPEPELEPTPEPEPEEVPGSEEESPREEPEDDERDEERPPGRRKQTAQEWVIEEIMDEI